MFDAVPRTPHNIVFASSEAQPKVTVTPVYDLGSIEKTFAHVSAGDRPAEKLFSAKRGQIMVVPKGKGRYEILLGMGSANTLTETACEEIGTSLQKALAGHGFTDATLDVPKSGKGLSAESIAAHIASGVLLKAYSFNKYKSDGKAGEPVTLHCLPPSPDKAAKIFSGLQSVSNGVYLARDLANEPPNVAYPSAIANHVVDTFEDSNVRVRVIDPEEMKSLGMGGILAVGQGSRRPPRIVVMEYDGTNGASKNADIALVGKGVTFDTGGISIKPAGNMQDMKYDMSGAADVIGTMLALSQRNAKAHVVGIVGLAENMPDGNAYRPGDVIRLFSKKTVEVINTDAEGRLVLCDCLTYVEKMYKPKAIIDLATLTGACVAALGHSMAAVITRDEDLQGKIVSAGKAVNELCWPMPLHEDFTRAVHASSIADIKNQAAGPGTSTAAAFLETAILKKTPWAHLDIAGMAWGASGKLNPDDGSASGFGVRLLNRLIADNFEHHGCTPAPAAACKHKGPKAA